MKAGFINAKSVGFRADRKVYNDARGGWDFLENTLLEHSYVGLPANVEATVAGRAAPDAAAVRKWFAEQATTQRGRKGPSACPAGADCPNDTNAEHCPAARLCPLSGHARASWRSAEPVIELIDDRDDDVLILDVGGYPRTLTRAKIEQLVDARMAKAADAAVKTAMAQARLGRRQRP